MAGGGAHLVGIDDVSLARCCLTCPCSREVAERWPFAERRSCLALALAGADLPAVSCHHRCRREASERAAPRTWRGGSGSVPAAAARRSSHAPRLLRHVRGGLGRTPSPRHRRPCQLVRTLNIFPGAQHKGGRWKYLGRICDQISLVFASAIAQNPRQFAMARPPAQKQPQPAAAAPVQNASGFHGFIGGFHVECTPRCPAPSAWPGGHPGLIMFLCLPSLQLPT